MSADTFAIRPATDLDRRRLSSSLAVDAVPPDADIFVAVSPEPETLLGAGGVWFKPNRTFTEYADCAVTVGQPYRRNGIGRALFECLTKAAIDAGARQLRTGPLAHDSAGFQFALACRFEPTPATITYEAPMKNYIKAFTPVYEHIVARGRMPAGAKMIPLKDANREEVCELLIDNLGFPANGAAERLRGTEHGFSQTISQVALLDGKMVGAILTTYHGVMAMIEGTAVVPKHRRSWVNSALKYHIMHALIARGVQWVRFSANEIQHRDTANFGRRLGGRVLKKVSSAVLNLTPEP